MSEIVIPNLDKVQNSHNLKNQRKFYHVTLEYGYKLKSPSSLREEEITAILSILFKKSQGLLNTYKINKQFVDWLFTFIIDFGHDVVVEAVNNTGTTVYKYFSSNKIGFKIQSDVELKDVKDCVSDDVYCSKTKTNVRGILGITLDFTKLDKSEYKSTNTKEVFKNIS